MMSTMAFALFLSASMVAVENVRVEVGDGSAVENATVVFDENGIRSVGNAAPPSGAVRIDGTGKVLTPGFIESMSQLGMSEVESVDETNDFYMNDGGPTPAFRAADGFNPKSIRIPINRAGGVTSAVASPGGTLIYGAGSWFELTSSFDGMPDPKKPVAMFGDVSQDAAEAMGGARGGLWLRLREIFDDTRFYMENRKAFEKGDARRLSLSPMHLDAMIPVVEGKIPFVLHANRASDILAALGFAKEQKINLIIDGAAESWMVREEIAKAGVPVILRPSVQIPASFERLGSRDDTAALLNGAGVKLIISTSGWENQPRRLGQEAGAAVASGLARDVALRAITLNPAELFGKGEEVGSVAVGKRANLVLWSGDPLELSTVAERVWIGGKEQSLDNRQRKLAERYLPKVTTVRRTSSKDSPPSPNKP